MDNLHFSKSSHNIMYI